MTFKEFLQNGQLQGLFGSPIKSNPARVDHDLDKKFHKDAAMTPSTKKRGGSDIKRMMGRDKSLARVSTPTGDFPKSISLKRNVAGDFFKYPKNPSKPTKVKPPLGLSST